MLLMMMKIKVEWHSVAVKVTSDLALHRSCHTDLLVYTTMGLGSKAYIEI